MDNNEKKKHLISFLLDHTSAEFFFRFVDEGHAPHVSKYILGDKNPDGTYSNATICRNVVTTYPSSSANSHPMILTGSFAGKNDLISGQYWNLLGKKPKYVITDKAGLTAIKKYNEKLLSQECKTLFEYFEDSASFHAVNRGANFKILTIPKIITRFLPLLLKMRKKDDPGAVSPIADPELNRELFRKNILDILERTEENNHLWQAMFVVFLLTDQNAHKFGYDSKEYREAIEILDMAVRYMVEGGKDKKGNYVPGLKEMGYLDNIVWNIHTDHSGRPVVRDKFVMLGSVLKVEGGLYIVEGMDDKKFKKKSIKNLEYINAFCAHGSAEIMLWFGNDDGKVESFSKFHPISHYKNLNTHNPNIRYKPKKFDIIEFLQSKQYVQFVIIPEDEEKYRNPLEGDKSARVEQKIPRKYKINIFSSLGHSQISRSLEDGELKYHYHVVEGDDPLAYDALDFDFNSKGSITPAKLLELTHDHNLPDVFPRLFGFFDCIYAPNFLVTSSYDYHFWSKNDVFENKLRNVQSHGGLYRDESVVPTTFAGPGIKQGEEIPFARNIDILPTLLHALGVDYNEDRIDGSSIDDMLFPKDDRKDNIV